MVGSRFSHENLPNFPNYSKLAPSKLTLREASLGLLNLINESKLFQIKMISTKEETEFKEIEEDLNKFLEYTSRLLLE